MQTKQKKNGTKQMGKMIQVSSMRNICRSFIKMVSIMLPIEHPIPIANLQKCEQDEI